MTHLVAVVALHGGHVARLGAISCGVAFLIAVAALHNAWLVAILAHVSFLATVAADHWATITTSWTFLCKMTHLVAFLALHALGRARLGALLRVVTRLLAVAAGKGIDSLLCAVAGAMSDIIADDTLHFRSFNSFSCLFLAVLLDVSKLAAVAALWNAAIEWHAGSLLETPKVLLWCGWPALSEEGTLWLRAPVES